MFPFSNNLMNQYMADMYSSVNNIPNSYYCIPDNSVAFWNPLPYSEPNEQIHPFINQEQSEIKKEPPTQPNPKTNKPKHKEKHDSDAVFSSEQESPELSRAHGLKQKYGRNIPSNIFHQAVKTIKEDKTYSQKIRKIIEVKGTSIDEKQFWVILNRKTSKLHVYISLQTMQQYWKGHPRTLKMGADKRRKEEEFNMIFRILCRNYLKEHHLLFVYNVLKLQKESKRLHIKGINQMLQSLK